MEFLVGNLNQDKLFNAEKELKVKTETSLEDSTTPLTKDEKERGNERCQNLKFPADCSGFKGDVFGKPKVVLKKTHGWTEVHIFTSYYSLFL